MKLLSERITAPQTPRVSMAELVHATAWNWRARRPFRTRIEKHVDVPCRSPLKQGIPKRTARPALRVEVMNHSGVNDSGGRILRCALRIRWEHGNPYDTHADVRFGEIAQDRLQHRPGAGDARPSGRRKDGHESMPAAVRLKSLLQRFDALSQLHELGRCPDLT